MSDSKAEVLAKGLLERIGITDGILTHKPAGKEDYKVVLDIPDHTIGINMVMEALVNPVHGVISSIGEIKAVKEIANEHRAQVMNYLKATGNRLGLLINFEHYPKATIKRIIL